MKAVQIHSYGGPEQLKIENTPRPQINDNQVLVQILDAGVNPVDWKIRAGHSKKARADTFPLTMGQDFSGKITEIGKNVKNFSPGDEVFGFATGAYAEFAAIPPKEMTRKPEKIDFITAAAIPTAGLTAWQVMIDEGKVSGGQTVLIHGAAGGVGAFAVQLAKWKNAKVIATAAPEDFAYLQSIGVDEVIDYRSERFEEKAKEVDTIIDLVGGDTLSRSYQIIKRGGTIITTVGPLNEAEAKKRGIRPVQFLMKRDNMELAELAKLVEQGIVKPRVSQVLPLEDAGKAHDLNQKGKSHGKIVLQVAD